MGKSTYVVPEGYGPEVTVTGGSVSVAIVSGTSPMYVRSGGPYIITWAPLGTALGVGVTKQVQAELTRDASPLH